MVRDIPVKQGRRERKADRLDRREKQQSGRARQKGKPESWAGQKGKPVKPGMTEGKRANPVKEIPVRLGQDRRIFREVWTYCE